MKKFILVHGYKKEDEIYINIDHIGHIYWVPQQIAYGRIEDESYTTIGVTTHNNGGFRVKETPKEIIKLIDAKVSYVDEGQISYAVEGREFDK